MSHTIRATVYTHGHCYYPSLIIDGRGFGMLRAYNSHAAAMAKAELIVRQVRHVPPHVLLSTLRRIATNPAPAAS